MKPGDIVFQGKSKKGTEFVIGYPTNEDIPAMHSYINNLSQERTFVTFQGEEITLEQEEEFVQGFQQRMENKTGVLLVVKTEDSIIGVASIDLNEGIFSHVGSLAVSIAKGHRGEGIGSTLMEKVISEAEKNLSALKIITLRVNGNNIVAYDLYKNKFGFQEAGRIPKGVFHKNEYVDEVYMYKFTNAFQ